MAIALSVLNVGRGGKEVYIEDTTPEERDTLAEEMLGMMKKGFALFLIQGDESRQVLDYNKEKHQWVVFSDSKAAPKKGKKENVPAQGTKVKAVGQTAGG